MDLISHRSVGLSENGKFHLGFLFLWRLQLFLSLDPYFCLHCFAAIPMFNKHGSVKLPAWLDHFNARDLQTLFRCSVAVWVASLLMFIGPSLATIGTATFFAR